MGLEDELKGDKAEDESEEENEDEEENKDEEKPEAKKEEPKKPSTAADAIKKLKEEISDHLDDTYMVLIGSRLVQDFAKDEELAKAYLDNSQSLQGIYDHVKDEARKNEVNGVTIAESEWVWKTAREACKLAPKPKEEPKKTIVPATTASKPTKNKQEKPKQEKTVTKEPPKEEKKKDDRQMSIFDMI